MSASGPPGDIARESRRLLIVEDVEGIALAQRAYAMRLGWSVDAALSAEEARVLVGAVAYDVAMIDVRLGADGDEGLELAAFVREASPRTHILLTTGFSTRAAAERAAELGACRLMLKPLPLSVLREALDALAGAGTARVEP